MVETLRNSGVKVTAKPEGSAAGTFWSVLISWFPMILLIGVWVYFMRQASSGNNKAMSFGKSRARLIENTKRSLLPMWPALTNQNRNWKRLLTFLKDPSKFQRLGGKNSEGRFAGRSLRVPEKTLLAKAVAGEAKCTVFSRFRGSDFVEMFVGVGASRVRDMFAQAKKKCPPPVCCLSMKSTLSAVIAAPVWAAATTSANRR